MPCPFVFSSAYVAIERPIRDARPIRPLPVLSILLDSFGDVVAHRKADATTKGSASPAPKSGRTLVGHDARPDSFDLALRGLVTMGFRKDEARRAMDRVRERVAREDAEPVFLVREALALLC